MPGRGVQRGLRVGPGAAAAFGTDGDEVLAGAVVGDDLLEQPAGLGVTSSRAVLGRPWAEALADRRGEDLPGRRGVTR